MSQDLICCIEGDFRAARLTICQTSGSCLQIKSSRRKLFGVAMCQSVTAWSSCGVRTFSMFILIHSFVPTNCRGWIGSLQREKSHGEDLWLNLCRILLCITAYLHWGRANLLCFKYSIEHLLQRMIYMWDCSNNVSAGKCKICTSALFPGFICIFIFPACHPALKWRSFCKSFSY